MTTLCPGPETLLALDDGECPENEAEALRAHVASCAPCTSELEALEAMRARLRRPVVELDVERFARGVERAIREPAPRAPRWPWLGAAAALVLAAGATATWGAGQVPSEDSPEFRGRGGGVVASAKRDVALDLFQQEGGRLVPLASDAAVATKTVFAMSYATKSARAVHRVVVIAVDAEREVHWMYPSFVDPEHVPLPIELPPGRSMTPMPTVVRLEAPASGALVVIALLDPAEPAVVQRIEGSRREERTAPGLQALVGAEDVRSWQLVLQDGGPR